MNINFKKVTRLTGIPKEIFKKGLETAFKKMNNPKQFPSFLSFLYFCNENDFINHKQLFNDFYKKEKGRIKKPGDKFKIILDLLADKNIVAAFKLSYEEYLKMINE